MPVSYTHLKEADAFLKNYLAAFPKVSGYMDKTIADAKACGYVSTPVSYTHLDVYKRQAHSSSTHL